MAPFRKKTKDFSGYQKDPAYAKALYAIRSILCSAVVLHHVDWVAASKPEESACPLEMFFDGSDYGWCATLCQRLEPHAAPKVISIIAKGFTDVQQRWSAMERELNGLWQGVVGHGRWIRGFHTYCYIDHMLHWTQ